MSDTRDKPPHEESYTSLSFLTRFLTIIKNGVLTLEEGGGNFQELRGQLLDMVELVTDTDDYLTSPRLLDKGDCMIHTLVCHSVVPAIASQLDCSLSAKETYDRVVKMFHFLSRTTHLSLWLDIITKRMNSLEDVLPHLNKIWAWIDDLDRAGFVWTKDSILGICYQLGLPTHDDIDFSNVNVVLDAHARQSPDIKITARETKEAIRAESHPLAARDTLGFPNVAALRLSNTNPVLSQHHQHHQSPAQSYQSVNTGPFDSRHQLSSQPAATRTPSQAPYQTQAPPTTGARNSTPALGLALYLMPKFKHCFH